MGPTSLVDARAGNYWPTLEQELLLRAALLPGPVAVAAWNEVRPKVDLDRIDPVSQRLLPLLYRNLCRLHVDDPWLPRLKGIYRYAWSRNQMLFHHARALLGALAQNEIPTLVLKGAAVVLSHYGSDPGLRPMHDFDILVPTARAEQARDVLQGAGWSPVYAITPSFLRIKHAGLFQDRDGRHCDLHWHVFEECCQPGDDDELWEAAVQVDFYGTPTRVLSVSDQLLHVCAHGAKWTWEPPIRWIADATLILQTGGIDWRRLTAQAVKRHFIMRMRETLGFLRARMSAAVPDSVLEALSAQPTTRLERFEARVLRRQHKVLGQLPLYWCHHQRARRGGLLSTALTFPVHLQHAWGLPHLSEVPRGALRRMMRRMRSDLP